MIHDLWLLALWLGDAEAYVLTLGRWGLRQAAAHPSRFGVALTGTSSQLMLRLKSLLNPAAPPGHSGLATLIGAVAVVAGGVWLFNAQPLLLPLLPLLPLLALLPLAALAAGYIRLRDLLHNGLDR